MTIFKSRSKPEPKPESLTISMDALEEGLVDLQHLMELLKSGEQLAAEHVEALQLMAPSNPEETFMGALRNVLQVKASALAVARQYGAILDEIAPGVGIAPGEWSREDLVAAFASRAEVYEIYGDTLSKLLLMLQVEFTAEDDMRVLMSKIHDAVAAEQSVVQSTHVLVEIIESIAGYLGFPLDDSKDRSWTAAQVLQSLEGLVAHEKESLAFRRAVIETLDLRSDIDVLTQLKELRQAR